MDDFCGWSMSYLRDSFWVLSRISPKCGKHPDQWVAIYNKDIVEVNDDFDKLLENLRAKKIVAGHTVIEFLSTTEDIRVLVAVSR
jgi:hypothetical protein